mgnify:CR=1 FL=1
MIAGWLRPVGFLALMLGFGLRLDTAWQGLGGGLLLGGAVASVLGLIVHRGDLEETAACGDRDRSANAFPPPEERR